ncbi:MAG: alkaline phosphatase family protein, partial [Treponema sp.]|nr:alkaline phosphatase family protein [Treponema sp.]
ISSSALEFVDIDKIASPNFYVINTLLQSLGLFFFWFCCVYFLFGKKVQTIAAFLATILLLWSALNAFLFGGDYGNLSRVLIFDKAVADSALMKAFNIAVLIVAGAALFASFKFFKSEKFIIPLCATSLIAFLAIGAINMAKIHGEAKEYLSRQVREENAVKPAFHFSKEGKNVVVIMSDRASNVYAQTIMEAMPDLKEAFKDWTLYSHTLSYDSHTLLGAPPLYGGYEYTPLEMNKRDKVPLKEKNNEALLLMPRVFTEQADFSCQAVDLSWANYSWIPDMSICAPYPKIQGFNMEGKYTSKWITDHPQNVRPNATSQTIKRNFLWFAFFKECPMFLRESVYDDGAWWSSDRESSDIVEYISKYSVLDYLPQLTAFDGNSKGNFTLLQSMATHSSIELQAPDYTPSMKISDKGKFADFPYTIYNPLISSNVAMFKRVAKWMEYLKENGCYDNTRIIIVADHGAGTFNFDNPFFYGADESSLGELADKVDKNLLPLVKSLFSSIKDGYNLDCNHPLLMVKDFTDSASESPREFTVNDSFMTNADTPYLAFEGIVQKPVNPWTGKAITRKTGNVAQGVVAGGRYDPGKNGVYKFDLNGIKVYDVYNDMADVSNWKERKE